MSNDFIIVMIAFCVGFIQGWLSYHIGSRDKKNHDNEV